MVNTLALYGVLAIVPPPFTEKDAVATGLHALPPLLPFCGGAVGPVQS